MTSDTAATGFGRYLQAIRLEKGITLEKVAEETRIGLGTLKAIEQEVFAELPAEVFLKGFLRSYSKFVGADGNQVIRRYESQRDVSRKISHFQQEPQKNGSASLWRLAMALLILGLLMLFSIYGMKLWHQADHPAAEARVSSRTLPTPEVGISGLGRIDLKSLSPASWESRAVFAHPLISDDSQRKAVI